MTWLRWLIEYVMSWVADFRNWRRGYHRVGPRLGVNWRVTRGRTHAPKPGSNAKASPVVTLRMVHRNANGDWLGEHVVTGRVRS